MYAQLASYYSRMTQEEWGTNMIRRCLLEKLGNHIENMVCIISWNKKHQVKPIYMYGLIVFLMSQYLIELKGLLF